MPSISSNPRGRLQVLELGLRDYREVHALQKQLVEERRRGAIEDTLLIVEHPSVYTVGRRPQGRVPADAIAIERGGAVTFHNPGQIVLYPILQLVGSERNVLTYIWALEEAVIKTLTELGLVGERRAGATGVWIQGKMKKIASLGVAISRWVTYHGVAVNYDNDLRGFEAISPCGFSAEVMTSIQRELEEKVCMSKARVTAGLVEALGQNLGRQPYGVASFPIASTGQAPMASSHCATSASVSGCL